MSLDESLRHYQRQLERDGHDPRAIGAALLGASPERYLLLARTETEPAEPGWRRMTGIFAAVGGERWHALWARPIVTLEEVVTASAPFTARDHGAGVWDTKDYCAAKVLLPPRLQLVLGFSRVEEGWREPRDGPLPYQTANPHTSTMSAGPLFARYVARELQAALQRECDALDLVFRDVTNAAPPVSLLSATDVSWTEGTRRGDAVQLARLTAQDVARSVRGSSGTLVFDVAVVEPLRVRVRWTVEPAAPARRPRRTGRRSRAR